MFMTNENFDVVYEYIRENHIWDEINMDIAEDNDENTYIIIDSHSDAEKLAEVVAKVLELDDEKIYVDDVLGVEVVFSDEYTTCSDCHKIIRTSPDSYHWKPDYYMGDGFIACSVCFQENEDYQEAYLEERINVPSTANEVLTDAQLEGFGFSRYNQEQYENGYHHGQTDDPKIVYAELKDLYEDILFSIDEASQFYIKFSVWVRGEVE
jgi:hypothetical protein